jgi:hypothetical protein
MRGPHWEVYDSIVATMRTVYTFCCLSISYITEPVRLIILSLVMLVAKLSFPAVSHRDLASVRVRFPIFDTRMQTVPVTAVSRYLYLQ